jgi:hypothetical protein
MGNETEKNRRAERKIISRFFRYGSAPVGMGRTIDDFTGHGTTDAPAALPTITADVPTPTDPLGIVTLRMYTPGEKVQITGLINHYVGAPNLTLLAELSGNGKFRKHETVRKKTYLSRHADVPGDDYDKQRATLLDGMRERTKRRINHHVYSTIQQAFGLESLEDAADVFEKQRKNANQAVIDHVTQVYPEEMRTGIRNEVSFTRRPADLLEEALKSGTDPELQFEIRRLFVNTVIALHERKGRSRIADEKMAQIQTLLNEKFYAGKTGKNQHLQLYGLFDNETNELLGQILSEAPTEDPAEGTHYKTLNLPVRELKSGKFVLTLVDQKYEGNAIRKAVRKAHQRKTKGRGDTISVEEDVQDTYRMKLVVIGDQATTDEVTNEFFEIVTDRGNNSYFYNRDIMGDLILDADRRPTGVPTGRGEIQMGNSGGTGQSDKVNYTKIAIEFEGVANPIKTSVQSLESYIAEQLEVGTYDSERGEFTGPAWLNYAQRREEAVAPYFFPRTVYKGLPDLQQRDKRTPTPQSAEIARRLRETKIFDGH